MHIATSATGTKSKLLTASEKLDIMKWIMLTNAPHSKFVFELSIAVRKVTDGMLGWSYTGEVFKKCYKLHKCSIQMCNKF